jgi:hypothetical protein
VSSAATPEQRGVWAAEAMAKVEACFNEEERAKVLAECACSPSPAQMQSFGVLYRKCRSLEEYAGKRNKEAKGAVCYEAKDGRLMVSYPQCYCSMVKNAPVKVPKTWCLCSCEYTRRACEAAVGGLVEVKLLKSVIGGDDECLFEVRIL